MGQSDPPLSRPGIAQARSLAGSLRHVDFRAAYSSDLRRCMQTAEIIARHVHPPSATQGVLDVRPERRLREIDTGLWEGLSFDQVRRSYPKEHAERERDLVGYRFPGGESFRDLQERALAAFHDILEACAGNVLVVGHKGVNRVLLCHVLGLPLGELFSIGQELGCVTLIEIFELPDGGRRTHVAAPSGAGPA